MLISVFLVVELPTQLWARPWLQELLFKATTRPIQHVDMAVSYSFIVLVSAYSLLYQLVEAQFQLFPNGTGSTVDLSEGCTAALNAPINCDPYIQYLASNDYYGSLGNATLQDSLCSAQCGASLESYHSNVALTCANDPQPWPGVPAIWTGDVIWATYNRTCLKDPATGAYCIGMLVPLFFQFCKLKYLQTRSQLSTQEMSTNKFLISQRLTCALLAC